MKLAAILIAVPLAMASALLGTTAEKATSAATDRHHPVLLELFTSQGCSSCPPADRLAERLTKEPGLLVISRPVTYWDRLGWKDTLAREENTQLQRAYAARGLAGENGVFTPQIVIDGNRGAVGSNEAIIRQLIDYEAAAPAALSVRKLGDGSLAVGMAGTTGRPAELVLIALRSHVTVRIVAGENGNRSIGYTNVVVDEQVVDKWVGGKSGAHIPASQFRIAGVDRYALVLRQKNGGAVLASLPLV